MQTRFLFGGILAALFFSLSGHDALAQSEKKVDLGAQFTAIRFRDLDTTDAGFGGRISFNVTNNVALEGEVNFFPEDKKGVFESGRKTEGLFGVKTGIRSGSAGIFGKLRPGFIHFSRNFEGVEVGKTDFALDLGGVIEFYPIPSTVVRFDVGDTIIRFGERDFFGARFSSFTSHNLQFSAGVGVRF